MSRVLGSMYDDDLDAILSNLSSKINNIFCDREFVGCVKEDFDVILQNAHCNCVVFPKLKPIFLKILRYQALIFDLSVFYIGSGHNQVAVVCKKKFLKEQANECDREKNKEIRKGMEDGKKTAKTSSKRSSRVNRPTQSYYVPPAQRFSINKTIDNENTGTSKKIQTKQKPQKSIGVSQSFEESGHQENITEGFLKTNNENIDIRQCCEENAHQVYSEGSSKINNESIVQRNTNILEISSSTTATKLITSDNTDNSQLELDDKESVKNETCLAEIPEKSDESINVNNESPGQIIQTINLIADASNLLVDTFNVSSEVDVDDSINISQPIVQIDGREDEDTCSNLNENKKSIFLKIINGFISTNDLHNWKDLNLETIAKNVLKSMKLQMNNPQIDSSTENIEPLSVADDASNNDVINQIIKTLELFLLQNKYSEDQADKQTIEDMFVQTLIKEVHSLALEESINKDCLLKDLKITTPTKTEVDGCVDSNITSSKDDKNNTSYVSSMFITYNELINKDQTYTEHENDEMHRPIDNNRKSRSIIKHNIRNVDSLQLVQNETVSQKHQTKSLNEDLHESWEDMFDDDGDLQQEYVEEIVKHIGSNVKVVKASHDYSIYQNAKCQDLEHVIELYDFPSSLKTQDLIQLYRDASQEPMYIKWCDDTHALLVLSTPIQAQRALQIEHEIIKARPLSQASSIAAQKANSADLKPAMKRPQTNMQTARRLINTHLGTKSRLSKEIADQERQALKDAREQKRQERQNEQDAWEGKPHCAKNE